MLDVDFITLIHKVDNCYKPAMLYNRFALIAHSVSSSFDAKHMDGFDYETGEIIICDSCGKTIRIFVEEEQVSGYCL